MKIKYKIKTSIPIDESVSIEVGDSLLCINSFPLRIGNNVKGFEVGKIYKTFEHKSLLHPILTLDDPTDYIVANSNSEWIQAHFKKLI